MIRKRVTRETGLIQLYGGTWYYVTIYKEQSLFEKFNDEGFVKQILKEFR